MSRAQAMHAHSLQAFRGEALKLSARAGAVLEWVVEHGPHTDREVMKGMGFTDMNSVRPRITELVDTGLLSQVGSKECPVTGKRVRVVGVPDPQRALFPC